MPVKGHKSERSRGLIRVFGEQSLAITGAGVVNLGRCTIGCCSGRLRGSQGNE
jgi:hypothetical protein